MTSPEPWEDLAAAEREYISRRMALYANDPETQLRLALSAPQGVGTALRVLVDAPVELCMDLIDALFAVAATTHAQVGLARDVIARLDAGWLASVLGPLVTARLGSPDVSWEDFRRIAELLSSLDQRPLLDDLVRRADASIDEDVREVGEDFRSR